MSYNKGFWEEGDKFDKWIEEAQEALKKGKTMYEREVDYSQYMFKRKAVEENCRHDYTETGGKDKYCLKCGKTAFKTKTGGQKMTEKGELPNWENLTTEQTPAVELFDNNEHIVEIKQVTPKEVESTKYKGKKMYIFPVKEGEEDKSLIVSSIRLAIKLKALDLKEGMKVGIKSNGKAGTDRDYEVRVVE